MNLACRVCAHTVNGEVKKLGTQAQPLNKASGAISWCDESLAFSVA
jgi:hypothetical protein